ncbi:MAG TPA: amidohydrolase family protein [Candidatus Bathyarchaeia archaeon]|nr:amidohydrolase family protein [Candidatus Bathyarchaeia archaeon]
MNRRDLLRSASGLLAASGLSGLAVAPEERPREKSPRPRIIDCHGHCSVDGSYELSADETVQSLDLYGIDRICCSAPIMHGPSPPEAVSARNDLILGAMRKYPDRILGQCFLDPGHAQHAQDEITRCIVDNGMIGVKLYHQHRITDPVQFPVIERCIELGAPILVHGGYPAAPELAESQPNIATGEHFAEISKRYPEAVFICAHIGGGGDWERQIKGLREAPTVYVDTGGSLADSGMIERCVRELGVDRVLFACDGSMERGLGKMLDADLTADQLRLIYSENFLKMLTRRKI